MGMYEIDRERDHAKTNAMLTSSGGLGEHYLGLGLAKHWKKAVIAFVIWFLLMAGYLVWMAV